LSNSKYPVQLEWLVFGLLAFGGYLFAHKSGHVQAIALLMIIIILNGWISSNASAELYHDGLLIVDVSILITYYGMLKTLLEAIDTVPHGFWYWSAALLFLYALWDALLIFHCDSIRRRRYLLYISILFPACLLHLTTAYYQGNGDLPRDLVSSVNSGCWLSILGLWHFDKWRFLLRKGR